MDLAAACELVGFKWLPQNVCKWLQVDTKWPPSGCKSKWLSFVCSLMVLLIKREESLWWLVRLPYLLTN